MKNNEMASNSSDVLVVEDDRDINHLVCAFLRQAGYQCRSALDGAAGLRQADERSPGLVLLDVMLPDMDGFQLCPQLKSSQRTASVPVILVTALADDQNRLTGMACGASAYVPKPFHPEELAATVARFINCAC